MAESEQRLSGEKVRAEDRSGLVAAAVALVRDPNDAEAMDRLRAESDAIMAGERIRDVDLEAYHARQRANAAENAMRATPTKANTTAAPTTSYDPALVTALLGVIERAKIMAEEEDVVGTYGTLIPRTQWLEMLDAARRLREARGETP